MEQMFDTLKLGCKRRMKSACPPPLGVSAVARTARGIQTNFESQLTRPPYVHVILPNQSNGARHGGVHFRVGGISNS